jgi:hypothetical protein
MPSTTTAGWSAARRRASSFPIVALAMNGQSP